MKPVLAPMARYNHNAVKKNRAVEISLLIALLILATIWLTA